MRSPVSDFHFQLFLALLLGSGIQFSPAIFLLDVVPESHWNSPSGSESHYHLPLPLHFPLPLFLGSDSEVQYLPTSFPLIAVALPLDHVPGEESISTSPLPLLLLVDLLPTVSAPMPFFCFLVASLIIFLNS